MQGFSANRRPKAKIIKSAGDNEDEELKDVTSGTESLDLDSPPPIPAMRRLNRPAMAKSKGSKLKLSFGADEDADDEEKFLPKRSTLSQKMTESKGRKFGLKADAMPTPPVEAVPSRPSYTKEYLTQLRDSTPSTPKDTSRYLSDDSLESGVSAQPSTTRPAEILDEAVIRALKERRRERARGEDYISLNDEEDRPRKVVSDDEDDTYKTYVDEPVRLQKNMDAATKKHKQEQIQEALYHSDSETMSEVDNNEWENQQIAKAHPGLVKTTKKDIHAMPAEIPLVPTYAAALLRLQGQLEAMKIKRGELQQMVDDLQKEREEVKDREEAVQESLTKAGKEYEQLREEFRASGANRGLDEVGEFGTPVSTTQG